MNIKLSNALWAVAALLSGGVAMVSYRYLAGVGPVAQNVAQNPHFHPWILLHAGGAATALLLGPFLLLKGLRVRFPKAHRWMGRTYVVGCLVGGVGALAMAPTSTAGPIAQWGFGVLGVLWIVVNAQAWRLALQGRFAEHRRWMIRSFALTFGAVTLRLFLPLAAFGIDFMAIYRASAWLSWVPNLILAEIYLRRGSLIAPRVGRAVKAAA